MLYKLYHSIKFPLTPLHIKYSLFKQRWQSQSYKNSEYEEEDIVYTLERFDKPWKIHQWECLNDSEIGGDSLGNIEFKENAIQFNGKIAKDQTEKMQKPPFVGFQFRMNVDIEFSYFNLLRITAKTDGKPFKIAALVSTGYELGHKVHGYIINQKSQWCSYELPFKNLQLEIENKSVGQDRRLEGHLSRQKLMGFFVYRESKFDEEFQFSILDIQVNKFALKLRNKLVQDNRVSEFLENYTLPYFYNPDILRLQKMIDTGHPNKIYSLQQKQTNKESLYMNSFYKE